MLALLYEKNLEVISVAGLCIITYEFFSFPGFSLFLSFPQTLYNIHR